MKKMIAIVSALLFLNNILSAQEASKDTATSPLAAWRDVATGTFKFSAQRGIILIKGLPSFHTVKFRTNVAVNILGIRIVYADDSNDDVPVAQKLLEGEETSAIPVPDANKGIRDIEVQYESPDKKKRGKCTIRLLGLR